MSLDADPRLCPLAWRPRLTWLVAHKAAGVSWDTAWRRCREVGHHEIGPRDLGQCRAQVRACEEGTK